MQSLLLASLISVIKPEYIVFWESTQIPSPMYVKPSTGPVEGAGERVGDRDNEGESEGAFEK
jgi:hypothetical protein